MVYLLYSDSQSLKIINTATGKTMIEEIVDNMFGKKPESEEFDENLEIINMDETNHEIDMLYWELGGSD